MDADDCQGVDTHKQKKKKIMKIDHQDGDNAAHQTEGVTTESRWRIGQGGGYREGNKG